MRGVPFNGDGFLKFAFVNPAGNVTYWSNDGTSANGSEPSGSVSVKIRGGLYSILLGNTAIEGMGAIDPSIFQQYSDIHIRVWFNDGERGFQQLLPDHPFSSVPYALSAGNAVIAPGSVSLNMLSTDVQNSLGATIDRSRLSQDVLADLNRTIGEDQLSAEVAAKLNRTITLGDLDPQVVADLNDSVADGSITTNQLNEQILKYLRPEITQQPKAITIYSGGSGSIAVGAEGRYLEYQWKKNEGELEGETNSSITINDASKSLHEGNYSVVVTNDFGTEESVVLEQRVLSWHPSLEDGLVVWSDASDLSTISVSDSRVLNWDDLSGNGNHFTQATENYRPLSGINQINGMNALSGDSTSMVTFGNPFGSSISDAFVTLVVEITSNYGFCNVNLRGGVDRFEERWQAFVPSGWTTFLFDVSGVGAPNRLSHVIDWNISDQVIFSFYSSTSGNAQQVWKNGVLLIGDNTNEDSLTDGGIEIGLNGAILGEIFIINNQITSDTRVASEGYLAHKWGLAGELPNDHTYKHSVP